MKGTNGNKYSAVYIYSGVLPGNFYGSSGNAVPTTAQINAQANILATIQFNTTNATVTAANYVTQGSTGNPSSFLASKNYTRVDLTGALAGYSQITLTGITVMVANCGTQINLCGDVGSANSASFNSFGCISQICFTANDPIVRAANKGCGSTRQVTATFITTEARTITFSLYRDVAPFGTFTDSTENVPANSVGDQPSYNITTTFNAATNDYRYVADFNYTVQNGEKFKVWVVATTPGVTNLSTALAENTCAPLPVSFKSFTAVRSKSNVAIKWTTATEQNSKGFYVQRNTRGTWDNIALIFSATLDGNSTSDLSYSFNDLNNEKGISQYRILQFDFDGKAKASDTRSVRGEAMASKLLVYPNPSMDGKVSVVFEEGGALKNIIVSDMSGRLVKQYRNISTNNLSIEGLENGVYSIQVIDLSSAAMSVEKIVIKKR